MILDRIINRVFLKNPLLCIICIFIIFSIPSAFASEPFSLNVNSLSGENFSSKVLIDTKTLNAVSLITGSEEDYKSLGLIPPNFLKQIQVNLTGLYEGDMRVAYVHSPDFINVEKFTLILKLTTQDKSILKAFDIVLPKLLKKQDTTLTNESFDDHRSFIFSFTPFYRNIKRNISVGSSKVNSNVSLLMNRFQFDFKEKYSLFFDVGYGILKIKDSVAFSNLNLSVLPNNSVNMDSFDGGRSFTYGAGAGYKFIDTKKVHVDLVFSATRFSSESTADSLKILNTKAEVLWSEYKASIGTTYSLFRYFNPLIAVTYSEIVGDYKLTLTHLNNSVDGKKTLDEDAFLGVVVGFVSNPYDELYISVTSELINQTSFKVGLTYKF